jgi:hypothetical protein
MNPFHTLLLQDSFSHYPSIYPTFLKCIKLQFCINVSPLPHNSWFDHPDNILHAQIFKILIMQFSSAAHQLLPLRFKYSLSTILKHAPQMWSHVSHSHKITNKSIALSFNLCIFRHQVGKTKDGEQNGSKRYPKFDLFFITKIRQLWPLTAAPKYLKFATFSKDLLRSFVVSFSCALSWWDMLYCFLCICFYTSLANIRSKKIISVSSSNLYVHSPIFHWGFQD